MNYKFETKVVTTVLIEKSVAKETRSYNAYRATISINGKKISPVHAAFFTTESELNNLIEYVRKNNA